MTVYLVISLSKIPYLHRFYMVLANPTYTVLSVVDSLFLDMCGACIRFWQMRHKHNCTRHFYMYASTKPEHQCTLLSCHPPTFFS